MDTTIDGIRPIVVSSKKTDSRYEPNSDRAIRDHTIRDRETPARALAHQPEER